MDTGIGPTLREARNRRKVDLSEVEAAIKIRVRYLQAMENEEWDALPGGAYTRGFIRTYASYLSLDGDRLADDYRRATGPPGGERVPKRVEPVPTARRGPRRRPLVSSRLVIAAVCLVMVAVVVGIALAGGGGGSSSSSTTASNGKKVRSKHAQAPAATSKPGVAVRLTATAEVWVCLLDAKEEPLVDGQILEEGAEAGPFRSNGFEVALGNGSVAIFVDGKQADVPESSSPVGYRVDPSGKLISLEEGERPSCE
ncbi:MAG TPA: helix-turn-helix transcriptional regulator [Solirubrobacterales bacterium]|nr:helix-turn-helix transcriptional regulator [Solirubrobacterales bacterium]